MSPSTAGQKLWNVSTSKHRYWLARKSTWIYKNLIGRKNKMKKIGTFWRYSSADDIRLRSDWDQSFTELGLSTFVLLGFHSS